MPLTPRRIFELLLWPVGLILLVLIFHARAAAPGAAFDAPDLREYFVPVRHLVLDTVLGGEWPFWQRSLDAGFPMLGSSEMALLHPTTWLFAPFIVERALTLGLLTHLCVAAVAMFLWQRRLGRSEGAAGLAAIIFALGGFTSVHLEHWTFSASMFWLPIALLAVDAFIDSGRPRWFLLGSVALAGTWLGGAAQLAYFSSLLAGGYALFRLWKQRARWPALLMVPAGMMLASPVLYASLELSGLSPRAAGTTLMYAGGHYRLLEFKQLAVLLLPHAFGPSNAWSGPMAFHEMTGYVGIGALALVFASRPRGIGWYFAAIALVGLLASFGMSTPFWELLHRFLPGYASFRVPTRALFFVNVCVAFLAAASVDRLLLEKRRWGDGAILVSAGVFAAVCLWIGASWQSLGFRGESTGEAYFAAGVLAATALVVIARRWLPMPMLAAAIAVITFMDLRHHFDDFVPVAPAEKLAARWPELPQPTQTAPRVGVIRLPFNLPASQGLESPVGYSQILIGRVFDLFYATRSGHFTPSSAAPIGFEYGHQDIAPYSPLFPIWSVSKVVSAYPLRHPELRLEGRAPGAASYTYTAPLPIAFWSGQHRVLDDAAFQAQVRGFRPHEELIVAPTAQPLPRSLEGTRRVAATVLKRTANATELQLEAPADGLVALQDPWFPGWSVEVDGKPAKLLRANYAFMAVAVSAGAHVIRFRYFPTTLPWALASISFVLGAIAAWSMWRRRRSEARVAVKPADAQDVEEHPGGVANRIDGAVG